LETTGGIIGVVYSDFNIIFSTRSLRRPFLVGIGMA
jgi:hypothetical protein